MFKVANDITGMLITNRMLSSIEVDSYIVTIILNVFGVKAINFFFFFFKAITIINGVFEINFRMFFFPS